MESFMLTDTEIKQNGMNALMKELGIVDTERFFALIQRDNFDYTKWRKNLWKDKSVREISKEAMDFRNKEGK
jgi:hypothetical protein